MKSIGLGSLSLAKIIISNSCLDLLYGLLE